MLSVKLKLPFEREDLDSMQNQLRVAASTAGFNANSIVYLVYAVEEIGANVLIHSGASWMELRFDPTDKGGILSFLDDGEEFDPVESAGYLDEPVISEYVSGHLGLWTLKQMPFKQSWRRVDGINHLRFTAIAP